MLHVEMMKPFHTEVKDNKIRLVFAYQYFSLRKDDEVFSFIPVEGKEIVLNRDTLQVENLSEVFVFQKGNRFIRLPLYQLLLVSDVHDHLKTLIEPVAEQENSEEVMELIHALERENFERLMDDALSHRDLDLFYQLLATQHDGGSYV
ncbi:transcriptional regulator [Chryseomicrobium excrementi]|uniref:Transcriptional regulator n=1 Tax=Chryseomicrobium excrementi TaxID=2041346 RepID=A0A2M9F086_9BACL|nr:transcriptional regulator [Chryseomicrobium excrementi]PJK16865.1 transcriptional regulator [Chryseomicrobium excrementi]